MKGCLYRAASVCSGAANVGFLAGCGPDVTLSGRKGEEMEVEPRRGSPCLSALRFFLQGGPGPRTSLSFSQERVQRANDESNQIERMRSKTAQLGSERCGFNYLAKPLTLFKVPAQALCNHIWIMLHLGLLCCNRKADLHLRCNFLKNFSFASNDKNKNQKYNVSFQMRATTCL